MARVGGMLTLLHRLLHSIHVLPHLLLPGSPFWATGVDTLKTAGYHGRLKGPSPEYVDGRGFYCNLGEYLIMSMVTRSRTCGASSMHRIP
jgi:hypothetical protein